MATEEQRAEVWRHDTLRSAHRRMAMQEAAKIARDGCLVPPDGGSPTEAEVDLCDEISRRILAAI